MSALSAALLIFSFQFSLLFFHMSRQASAALRRIGFNTQYRTLDVAENLRRYLFCTKRTIQWKDFELILSVKLETRHPVEGQFSSKFLTICNHYAELWQFKVARSGNYVSNFWRCFGKRPLMVQFSKFCFECFYHRSTLLCSNVVKIYPTENR